MIEELKLLLDQMKNVPDVALWILGGFMAYKLITYLSATGAIIVVIKLLCKTLIDFRDKPRTVTYGRLFMEESVETEFQDLIRSIRRTGYVHSSDVNELRKAWDNHNLKKTGTSKTTI